MKFQPDFPADEPLLPAHGCQCDLCRQTRADTAAAAIITLVETSRNHFATKTEPPAAEAGISGNPTKTGIEARQSCTPASRCAPIFHLKKQYWVKSK